jgi:hypothetical protein
MEASSGMSATESDDAEAQRIWDQQVDIGERFADLAAEIGAEYAAGRWELGNGQRLAVDYEPRSMWFGLGGFRMGMAHAPERAWLRARRALERLDLDDADDADDDD